MGGANYVDDGKLVGDDIIVVRGWSLLEGHKDRWSGGRRMGEDMSPVGMCIAD